MTCQELYNRDPAFRAFLACWERDRRCPYGLADYLRELDLGLESQASAADWLASQPDRPVYFPMTQWEKSTPCGPFPTAENNVTQGRFFWIPCESKSEEYAANIPGSLFNIDVVFTSLPLVESLCAALDHYKGVPAGKSTNAALLTT